MLFCSFCGSSLAIESGGGPEHLILPHTRNDRNAELALKSFLAEKSLARARGMITEFFFVPFLMIENEKGKMFTLPAPGAPSWLSPLPFPPAGDYSYFDKSLAGDEKVITCREVPPEAHQLIHIPVYRIKYKSSGSGYRATVIGESLLVLAEDLPPAMPAPVSVPNILAAAGLFTIFLILGKFAGSWPGRIAMIILGAAAGYGAFTLRERMLGGAK